jgi:uncharacterized protein (TIGR00251 family)
VKDDSIPGYLRLHAEGCSLAVRVQPGAKREAMAGVYGDAGEAQLKIALKAAPIEGRANEALIAFLAEFFGLARSSVGIAQGQTGRSKLVILKTVNVPDAELRIRAALNALPSSPRTF